MASAVDFVLEFMKKISSSEPVLFQRDGALYVASAEGIGQVSFGLQTRPLELRAWETKPQPPEILDSKDVTVTRSRDDGGHHVRKKEIPYFKHIAFGPDTTSFTLEDITKAARELAQLPQDGKIRMVSHGSRHHSHKYSYGCDGIDVWVESARVIDSNRYLELIRKREDNLVQAMADLAEYEDRRRISREYDQLKIPACLIITPYLLVSLPRGGRLHLHTHQPDSWTSHTPLEQKSGSILHYGDTDTYKESPFSLKISINAQNLEGKSYESVQASGHEAVTKIGQQLSAVDSVMPIAQDFITRMNSAHNTACAKNISWGADLDVSKKIGA